MAKTVVYTQLDPIYSRILYAKSQNIVKISKNLLITDFRKSIITIECLSKTIILKDGVYSVSKISGNTRIQIFSNSNAAYI